MKPLSLNLRSYCDSCFGRRNFQGWQLLLALIVATGFPFARPASAEPVDLPLPSGGFIRFQPIFLGADPNLLAVKDFTMGDRRDEDQASILERIAETRIGGSFLARRPDGKMDWCYYLSEAEVTESQWADVLGDLAPTMSNLPKTRISFHEVQTFLSEYNQWLRSEKNSSIPNNEGKPGFVRLPTEAEWEFACRGGSAVPPELFNQQIPYLSEADLKKCERIYNTGLSSKLKPVKSTGKPTVLGLYDMLGNASEITDSLFSLDRFTGRVGGYVVRGPNLNSKPIEVRSSNRFEQAFYTDKGVPTSGSLVGFRPAIGSEIFWSDSVAARLAKAITETPATDRTPRFNPSVAGEGTADATSAQLSQARERIESLERQNHEFLAKLENKELGKEQVAAIKQQQDAQHKALITLLRADLANAEAMVYERDRKIAAKSVRMVSRLGRDMVINHEKATVYESELTEKEKVLWKDHYPIWQANLKQAWEDFQGEVEELHNINPKIRGDAFDTFRLELINGGFREQADALIFIRPLVENHRKGILLDLQDILRRLIEAQGGRK